MNHIYAGVGSRETPVEIQAQMRDLAFTLANNGMMLRSGGAIGADQAFESGCVAGGGTKEIYVMPFPNEVALPDRIFAPKCEKWVECLKIARDIHPAWNAPSMTYGARGLHARNVMQVLGKDLRTPVDFLVCWAPVANGSITGGTRTAWELAKRHKIPVFNLAVMGMEDVRQSIARIMAW